MGYTPPWLEVRKIAGGYSLSTPGATTDDLTILPNPIDARGYITIEGTGDITLAPNAALVINTNAYGNVGYINSPNATDTNIATYANRNLSITPNGSGLLKYGTYVAGAKADSTGYIEILDSGGNSRRLMVQAV
jgi:hypothetical protein